MTGGSVDEVVDGEVVDGGVVDGVGVVVPAAGAAGAAVTGAVVGFVGGGAPGEAELTEPHEEATSSSPVALSAAIAETIVVCARWRRRWRFGIGCVVTARIVRCCAWDRLECTCAVISQVSAKRLT